MIKGALAVVASGLLFGAVILAAGAQAVKQTPLRTTWGEPDLTGVWKGQSLGASAGPGGQHRHQEDQHTNHLHERSLRSSRQLAGAS